MGLAKRAPKCKVIAMFNQKGGVGKSTSTIQLAAALARLEKKVLVIDADSQGTVTKNLGFRNLSEDDITLTTVFDTYIDNRELKPSDGILSHDEGFDLLPCNLGLAGYEMKIVKTDEKSIFLKKYVDMMRKEYEIILIDCMPSLGIVPINVLVASDSVIVPVEPDLTSADGFQDLQRTVFKSNKSINPGLKIEGILFTKFDGRTNYAKLIYSEMKKVYGDKIHFFEKEIPKSIKVAECARYGTSIFTLAPKSSAAIAYMSLAKEVSR